MKADYLFILAKMLRARELGDEALENDLSDELDNLWAEMTDSQRMKLNAISAKIVRSEISLRELPYRRVYVYAHGAVPLPGINIPSLDVICARHSKKACLMSRKTIQSRLSRKRYSALVPSIRHYILPAS